MSNNRENYTARENFLMSLLNKIMTEYKTLLEHLKRKKPFKIIEIIQFSPIPGESEFLIQVANKNCAIKLSAAEIINNGYNLDDFSDFHAEMIRQAAQGKLVAFLKMTDQEPNFFHDRNKR
jgi:hypothetical protein